MTEVLSYRYPPILPELSGNNLQWVSTAPFNSAGGGGIYRSDQNQSIIFNFASQDQFLSTVQSFFNATLTPYDSSNNVLTSPTNSYQGLSRIFQRLIIRIGGAIVEDIPRYNDLVGLSYATETNGRKRILTLMEGWSNTNFVSGATEINHMIYSSLFVTRQCFPLPLVNSGGISVELVLAPASEAFTSTNVSYYTLTGVSFKWLAVIPPPEYTLAMKSKVLNGSPVYMAYQRCYQYPSSGNGSNTQLINIPAGAKQSIVSVDTVFWDSVAYATVTNDKYLRFTNAGLLNWSLKAANTTNPYQVSFNYNQGTSKESILTMLLSQFGDGYRMGEEMALDSAQSFDTKSFRVGLNFQSEGSHFATGLSTIGSASPFITLQTQHSAPVSTTTSILTFVVCDALIVFHGSQIDVLEAGM